ncbi:DNA topoisomerase IA [Paenibacillus mucilaginosus]|uniref:DNA topoisomerase n=1 Tax=Paenibacillus mucilaginosus TaxID=61624 RepID=UPI003D1A0AE0
MASLLGNKRYVNPEKVSDHYAILPTDSVPDIASMGEDEHKIYDLIVRRVIAAHYEPAIDEKTEIITYIDDRFFFRTRGKRTLQEGWRVVYHGQQEDAEDSAEEAQLPRVQEEQEGIAATCETKEGKTTPPPQYTEGDLIPLMKSAGRSVKDKELERVLQQTNGLGTEATRSGMIQTLKARKYIDINANPVYPTRLGRILIEAVGEGSVLTSAEMTARWEQQLSEIEQGKMAAETFLSDIKSLTTTLVHESAGAVEKMAENQWDEKELTKSLRAAFWNTRSTWQRRKACRSRWARIFMVSRCLRIWLRCLT